MVMREVRVEKKIKCDRKRREKRWERSQEKCRPIRNES